MAGVSLTHEIFFWRTAGAAAWHFAASLLAVYSWTIICNPNLWISPLKILSHTFSFTKGFLLSCTCAFQLLSLFGTRTVITVLEPQPLYLVRFGFKLPVKLAIFSSKLLSRLASINGLVVSVWFIGAHIASAVFFLTFDYSLLLQTIQSPGDFAWSASFSVTLALVYCSHFYYRSLDVLRFPVINRHRYFRIKQRIPSAIVTSAQLTGISIALHFAATMLSPRLFSWLSWSNFLAACSGGMACMFCWMLGRDVLEVVFTERLDFDAKDTSPPSALLSALANDKDGLMLSLALLDVVVMAETGGGSQDRRWEMVFRDETGATWRQLATALQAMVERSIRAAAGGLPQNSVRSSMASNSGSQEPAARWNVLPQGVKAVGGPLSAAQDASIWQLRCRYQHTSWAVRALGALCAASCREDQFGVLQLNEPSLGAVTVLLASLLLVLQQYLRYSYSLSVQQLCLALAVTDPRADLLSGGMSSQGVDPVAYALQDSVTSALYCITNTFGESIVNAVQYSSLKPLHGTLPEVTCLIKNFLAYKE